MEPSQEVRFSCGAGTLSTSCLRLSALPLASASQPLRCFLEVSDHVELLFTQTSAGLVPYSTEYFYEGKFSSY